MTTPVKFWIGLLLWLGLAVCHAAPDPSPLTASEVTFLKAAHGSASDKVKLAELALAKTTDANLKDLATELQTRHQKMAGEFLSLAALKNVEVSDVPGAEATKLIESLNKKEGKEFDAAFLEALLQWHLRDIKSFESTAPNVIDEQLKLIIQNALPVLKDLAAKIDLRRSSP